jgi:hypothetical protein
MVVVVVVVVMMMDGQQFLPQNIEEEVKQERREG